MRLVILFLIIWGSVSTLHAFEPTSGPLKIHPRNPNWFANSEGQAVYLIGSHNWSNFQDLCFAGDEPFDHDAWLQFMVEHGFNFQRFWSWEQSAWATWTQEKMTVEPTLYRRVGDELALDGKEKFDLSQFNQAYFDRMRERIMDCRDRGVYCAVMLFQAFSYSKKIEGKQHVGNPFRGHPLNAVNNIQGFNGDRDDDSMIDLDSPEVRAHHAAYIHKVIDTINDLDNVMYEVINEGGTEDWQYFVVKTVNDYQATKPNRHLVGITGQGAVSMKDALASDCDWLSPGNRDAREIPGFAKLLKESPLAWSEPKPSVLDTDHLWGHGINDRWVWKSFLRGHHVLFMDTWRPLPRWFNEKPFDGTHYTKNVPDFPGYNESRSAMKNVASLCKSLELEAMKPHPELSSTEFCLADPGHCYVVFVPTETILTIQIPEAKSFTATWIATVSGKHVPGGRVTKATKQPIIPPITGDCVLLLQE